MCVACSGIDAAQRNLRARSRPTVSACACGKRCGCHLFGEMAGAACRVLTALGAAGPSSRALASGTGGLTRLRSAPRAVQQRAASSAAARPPAFDVVICGGGIVGCNAAYFLAAADPNLKVAVVERDARYTHASTCVARACARPCLPRAC